MIAKEFVQLRHPNAWCRQLCHGRGFRIFSNSPEEQSVDILSEASTYRKAWTAARKFILEREKTMPNETI